MQAGVPNQDGIIGHADDVDGPGPHIMAADTLTGEKVVNQDGESLGEITHIMLDISRGTIAYAVLSFGGLLGINDKLFAVPWNSLALDVDNKWFVLNVDKERLKKAPGFDKHHWPAMADPAWAAEVSAYYGPVAVTRRPFI
jgi:sporulation protein YlmC with PRC-barrel domain